VTTVPLTFSSMDEHVSRLGDTGLWQPYVDEILNRHDLGGRDRMVAGFNPTSPTFVCGDWVVKLFGFSAGWRKSHAAERAAHALIASDPKIAAPRVFAEGVLFADHPHASWPYVVTTKMPGVSWRDADLSGQQRRSVAVDLGKVVRRVHALRPAHVATHADWAGLDVAAAAEQSSLPSHLVAQVDRYLGRLDPFDEVFVHGDLCAMHAFVKDGRLSGIIDWGDAMVTDRHYELIQIYRDLFDCDKALLRVFLDACDWPVGEDFARRTLGLALHRQAVGLAQHHSMDIFEPIAALLPLRDIATLDDLATELFAL